MNETLGHVSFDDTEWRFLDTPQPALVRERTYSEATAERSTKP